MFILPLYLQADSAPIPVLGPSLSGLGQKQRALAHRIIDLNRFAFEYKSESKCLMVFPAHLCVEYLCLVVRGESFNLEANRWR